MSESARVVLYIAKRRAFSSSVRPFCADTVRKMRNHVRAPFSAQYRDEFVWNIVRVALFSEPIDLTWLNSVA